MLSHVLIFYHDKRLHNMVRNYYVWYVKYIIMFILFELIYHFQLETNQQQESIVHADK